MELKEEGGVTQISLHNARELINERGIPDAVELYWRERIGHCVQAIWLDEEGDATSHVFSGFSWGYAGEGPHGLLEFFEMIGMVPRVTIAQIGAWARGEQHHFALATHYGFRKEVVTAKQAEDARYRTERAKEAARQTEQAREAARQSVMDGDGALNPPD